MIGAMQPVEREDWASRTEAAAILRAVACGMAGCRSVTHGDRDGYCLGPACHVF